MSIMDDVAALHGMAEQVPTAQIRQIQQDMLELCVRIRAILGENAAANETIVRQYNRMGIRLESAATTCLDFANTVHAVADSLQQIDS